MGLSATSRTLSSFASCKTLEVEISGAPEGQHLRRAYRGPSDGGRRPAENLRGSAYGWERPNSLSPRDFASKAHGLNRARHGIPIVSANSRSKQAKQFGTPSFSLVIQITVEKPLAAAF
jgi:hypothetical protein